MAKIGPKELELRRQREKPRKVIPIQSKNLTDEERGRLTDLVGVVKRGLQTFVEVGTALAEIKEARLYRERCSTFEAFVQIEFGMSRQHAYKQIAAAEVVAEMSHNATLPETLTQAVELGKLPPAEREEALAEARQKAKSEGTKTKTKHVTEAVAARRPKKPKAKPAPSKPTDPDQPDPVAEWERLGKENDQLREKIEAITTTAPQKQIAKLQDRLARLDGRLQQEIKQRQEAVKQASYGTALLKKIRAALKVEKNAEIMDAIADLKR